MASFCSQDGQVNTTEEHASCSEKKRKEKKISNMDWASVDFLFTLLGELRKLPGNLSY